MADRFSSPRPLPTLLSVRAQPWYDLATGITFQAGKLGVVLTMDSIPSYQRGGSIIARWDRPRRSSYSQIFDPYTLVVAPDNQVRACASSFALPPFDQRQLFLPWPTPPPSPPLRV